MEQVISRTISAPIQPTTRIRIEVASMNADAIRLCADFSGETRANPARSMYNSNCRLSPRSMPRKVSTSSLQKR
jgi:hypothetical protein